MSVYTETLPPLGFFGIDLKSGAHDSRNSGVCAMEAVAWLAGENHTDHPQCVCPVIGAFIRSWNDSLPDADRDRLLKPILPTLIGSRSTAAIEERRGWMAIDWLIREFAPEWLALVHDLAPHAAALRELPEIADSAAVKLASPKISAADSVARSAARSAADSVARSAARSAADSAARSAARSAADSAAYSAARSAAYSVADSAARSAARSVLAPATAACQQSALRLVARMLAVTA